MSLLFLLQICSAIRTKGWRTSYDSGAEQATAFGDNQWVSYDNLESIAAKTKFIKSQRLGGAMIWSLDFDDFNGQACGQGKYPLLKAINNVSVCKQNANFLMNYPYDVSMTLSLVYI